MLQMKNIFDVSKKIVIITGGSGQLGSQFTRALLENGAKVAIFDINIAIDKKNKFMSSRKRSSNLKFYKVDITSKVSIKENLEEVLKDLGEPSILINNAALDVPPDANELENGPFETYPEGSWDKTVAVNLKGTFIACQVIGGYLAERGRGSVINIASIYGNVSPDQRIYEYRKKRGALFIKPVSYTATKAGVIGLTKYLATYWAPKNVRVNVLSFGGVFNNQDPEFLSEYCKRVPMGRMAKEDEYNGAILFLASDASSYMTGANIIIDGGLTSW